jgi:hypothetical protein
VVVEVEVVVVAAVVGGPALPGDFPTALAAVLDALAVDELDDVSGGVRMPHLPQVLFTRFVIGSVWSSHRWPLYSYAMQSPGFACSFAKHDEAQSTSVPFTRLVCVPASPDSVRQRP